MTYNHVAITGTLTKEPEFKQTPSGTNYCKFTLNVDASFTDKDAQLIKKTSFIPVTLWAKTCEEARSRIEVGKLILVSGSLKQESYKDKDGNPKSILTINGTSVMYMESDKPTEKTTTEKIMDKFPGKLKDAVDLPDELPF